MKTHSILVVDDDKEIRDAIEIYLRNEGLQVIQGSGPGLAIAKSIIDLHSGKFLLDIDGDLFKATIMVPNG